MGWRSFKVIEFVTDGKDICNFLLVVNSNLGLISHGFEATAIYWSKGHLWDIRVPLSHVTPSLGVSLCEYEFYIAKSRYNGLPAVKTASSYVHSFWHNTGVWRTDRQTDRNALIIRRTALRRAVTKLSRNLEQSDFLWYQVKCWCDEAEQLFRGQQRSKVPSTKDLVELLDKLDYCDVELLRNNLDRYNHSATTNTVITTIYVK